MSRLLQLNRICRIKCHLLSDGVKSARISISSIQNLYTSSGLTSFSTNNRAIARCYSIVSTRSRILLKNDYDNKKYLPLYTDLELTTRRLLDGSAVGSFYTPQIFNNTLNDWAKAAQELAKGHYVGMLTISHIVDHALALLSFMEQEGNERKGCRIKPNLVSYNSVLKVLAIAGDIDKACDLFLRMQEMKIANSISLNITLNSFASRVKWVDESSAINIGERAENLIEKVRKGSKITPDIRTYNTLVNIWANAKCGNSIERALSVIRCIKETLDLDGDVITLNTLLKAVANCPTISNKGQQAESILALFEKEYNISPNEKTFGALLNVWAKSFEPNAAYRAEEILKRMEQLAQKGNSDFQPNLFAYTTVIDAFANRSERDKNAANIAASILEKLFVLAVSHGEEFRPNVVCCNTVIKAYARSNKRGSTDKAFELLNLMIKGPTDGLQIARPNIISFNTVLMAFATNNEPKAWEKALSVFSLLKHLSINGDISFSPNLVTYSTLLHAIKEYPNRQNLVIAEALLGEMERISKQGNLEIFPDNRCYTFVISAYAKSSEMRKAWKAKQLLDRMMCNGINADIYTYTAALSACRNSIEVKEKEKVEILDILLKFIDRMKIDKIHPNEVTYAVMLEAIARLCTDEGKRTMLLKKIFTSCCKEGFVTKRILDQIPMEAREQPETSWNRNVSKQIKTKYRISRTGTDK